MKAIVAIGGTILAVLGFIVVVTALNEFGVISYRFFGTQYEAARRDIMVQSRAYTEGETRNLYRWYVQYKEAPDQDSKDTIRLAAQHECEAFDRSRLPPQLAAFCNPLN